MEIKFRQNSFHKLVVPRVEQFADVFCEWMMLKNYATTESAEAGEAVRAKRMREAQIANA